MEEGSVLAGVGNGKASDGHSWVVEIEMGKMPLEQGGCCRRWVVEMEKMLEDANFSVERVPWNRHCIYRVPQFMKDMTNSQAFSPLLVSLGPYHHGKSHLQPMEEHKRRALLHMVNRSGKPLQVFVEAIDEVADDLQAAYNDLQGDKWRGANKHRFVEVMVTDGCFLLELAWSVMSAMDDKDDVMAGYATNDLVFDLGSYKKLWPVIRSDMIAMENQLPLIVLQRLLTVYTGEFSDARMINRMVKLLLQVNFDEGIDELAPHFLYIFHKSYCAAPPHWVESRPLEYEARTPCAVQLAEAGIRFKKSETDSIHDVDFDDGVLSMPLLDHDLLNLMAFEWLHPDANFYVASYVSFVGQLIESERDVALLRSEGIFRNILGSDKKVVGMFNTLTGLAWTPDEGSKLGHVSRMVNRHCKKRRNKWRAIFMKTYLSDPWVITSMVAAFLLLVASLMQTVYTVVPFYTRNG